MKSKMKSKIHKSKTSKKKNSKFTNKKKNKFTNKKKYNKNKIMKGGVLKEIAAMIFKDIKKEIGCDTVIYTMEDGTILINAHLKDYKEPKLNKGKTAYENPDFTKQMSKIIEYVETNLNKKIVVMCDANTIIDINQSNLRQIEIRSKDKTSGNVDLGNITTTTSDGKLVPVNTPITTTKSIYCTKSKFTTSNKMRGVHTVQLTKMFVKNEAIIDYVLFFNWDIKPTIETKTYVINSKEKQLDELNDNVSTTPSLSIADHALVISKVNNGDAYGTLNIKGGNSEDKTWAEFLPQDLIDFFTENNKLKVEYKKKLDNLLLEAVFDEADSIKLEETIKEKYLSNNGNIASSKVYSTENTDYLKQSGIFDWPYLQICSFHLPNNLVPMIKINIDSSIDIISDSNTVICKIVINNNNYVLESKSQMDKKMQEWINILLTDLNTNLEKEENSNTRLFFVKLGYKILNFWYKVQHDESFKNIYDEWYKKSDSKCSIGEMIKLAKEKEPRLKILGLQEFPVDINKKKSLIENIEDFNKEKNISIVLNDSKHICTVKTCGIDNKKCEKSENYATQGAIIIFN